MDLFKEPLDAFLFFFSCFLSFGVLVDFFLLSLLLFCSLLITVTPSFDCYEVFVINILTRKCLRIVARSHLTGCYCIAASPAGVIPFRNLNKSLSGKFEEIVKKAGLIFGRKRYEKTAVFTNLPYLDDRIFK